MGVKKASNIWTDEVLAQVYRLYDAGYTCPQIAARLSINPNTLRGKLTDLGLTRRVAGFAWTDKLIERAVGLWQEGHSASVVANIISTETGHKFTRNSVLSRIHRSGQADRKAALTLKQIGGGSRSGARHHTAQKLAEPESPQQKRYVRAPQPASEPRGKPFPGDRHSLNIADIQRLEDHHCRWPIGHVGQEDFVWCGLHKAPGSSYCAEHLRRSRPDDFEARQKYIPKVRKREWA